LSGNAQIQTNSPALRAFDLDQLIQIKCRRRTAARPPDVHNYSSKTATSRQQIFIIERSPNYTAPVVATKNLDADRKNQRPGKQC